MHVSHTLNAAATPSARGPNLSQARGRIKQARYRKGTSFWFSYHDDTTFMMLINHDDTTKTKNH
jgi:hypothetical protein